MSDTPQPISLEFTYRDEDLEHIWTTVKKPDKKPWLRKGILLLIPILGYEIVTSGFTWVSGILGLVLLGWSLEMVTAGRPWRNKPLGMPRKAADIPVTLFVDNRGFRFVKGQIDTSCGWKDCREVHRGEHGFLLFAKRPVFVPMRVLREKNQLASFEKLLRTHLRPEQVRH